jgi:hypothetical protein
MTDRIDQYLEGTLNRDGLDASERVEADATIRAVSETRAFIGARPAPDFTAAVMQRVNQLPRPETPLRGRVFATVLGLLWTPRQVSIRPAYAAAAAGAVLAVLLFVVLSVPDSQMRTLRTTDSPHLFVQFRLQTNATNVQLAGSFTNWQPAYQLHQVAPGAWTITVPLPQGVHDYAFVVDGRQWVADPYAAGIDDGFGGTSSRLTLLLPETPRL